MGVEGRGEPEVYKGSKLHCYFMVGLAMLFCFFMQKVDFYFMKSKLLKIEFQNDMI